MKGITLSFMVLIFCLGEVPKIHWANYRDTNITNETKIIVKIEGIRSKKGKIILAVFEDQEGFKTKNPTKRIVLNKSKIDGNEIVVSLDKGIYGISILDDENDNDKMDYNFFGMPKEGFGFSNYYHEGFSKPKFDTFKFEIKNQIEILIDVRLRYM
jgi:uncharacterized protein (DUF2141 family)